MAEQLRYDGQVVVITGAGGGLGKALCHLLRIARCQRCCKRPRRRFEGRGNLDKGMDEAPAAMAPTAN